MPEYIASGKDRFAESSVKVSADSDAAALFAARQKLPVITGLERIETNGTLTPVTGLTFDSPHTILESESETHDQRSAPIKRRERFRRGIAYLFVFFGACIGMEYCNYKVNARSAAHPASATMPQNPP